MGRPMDTKMNKSEYEEYSKIRANRKLDALTQEIIATLHAKYFNHQFFKPCSCSGKTWQQWIAQLNDLWDNGYTDSTST